jgi:hypothetical protein
MIRTTPQPEPLLWNWEAGEMHPQTPTSSALKNFPKTIHLLFLITTSCSRIALSSKRAGRMCCLASIEETERYWILSFCRMIMAEELLPLGIMLGMRVLLLVLTCGVTDKFLVQSKSSSSFILLPYYTHFFFLVTRTTFPSITHYDNDQDLIKVIKDRIAIASQKTGRLPRVMVMGALGRCGSGAVNFARHVGIPE